MSAGTAHRATEKIPADEPTTNLVGSVAYNAAAPRIAIVGKSGDSPSSSVDSTIRGARRCDIVMRP